jgi:methionine-rich copper-binding protein CopC
METDMSLKSRLIIVLAASGFAVTAAAAHPKLLTAVPAAGSTVNGPTAIKLDFNEAVVDRFSGIELQMTEMPGMKMTAPMKMTAGAAVVGDAGKQLMTTFAKPLSKGVYKVSWHAVAADTHRVEGNYSFTVK